MTGILLSLALALLPAVRPETGQFSIYQNGKKIGTEEFTIKAQPGGYVIEGETKLTADPVPIKSRMELDDQLNLKTYEYHRGAASIRLKVDKPLSEYASAVGSDKSSVDFRFPDGGLVIDNNLFHHYVLLLYKAAPVQTSLPVFVPQDMRIGSATIRSKGDRTFELDMGDVHMEATTDADGRLIRLSVPSAKVVVER